MDPELGVRPSSSNEGAWGSALRRFKALRRPLQAFVVISLTAFFGSLTILIPPLQSASAALNPFTGGVVTPFILFLVAQMIISADPPLGRRLKFVVFSLLGFGICFGMLDFVVSRDLRDDSNPWLRYSQWRPLWTMGAPFVAIGLFVLPSSRRLFG